jgi:hypothetical protein
VGGTSSLGSRKPNRRSEPIVDIVTDRESFYVARGHSPAGRIVRGDAKDICPNCGQSVDDADVQREPPRREDRLPGAVEVADCRNLACRASLARLRFPDGEVGLWTAVVAVTEDA